MQIRKAETRDLSRIAEILVFVKRINYRPIFQNDAYSFGELQVLNVARQYAAPEILGRLWVYDDGIVKGLIHIEGEEIRELYVDHFFQGQGIGAQLIEFAKERFLCRHLWALEKNTAAIRFYRRHGFFPINTLWQSAILLLGNKAAVAVPRSPCVPLVPGSYKKTRIFARLVLSVRAACHRWGRSFCVAVLRCRRYPVDWEVLYH